MVSIVMGALALSPPVQSADGAALSQGLLQLLVEETFVYEPDFLVVAGFQLAGFSHPLAGGFEFVFELLGVETREGFFS
ncbi:hypothetical protein [Streptomyces californicus]|uniref:hypothetical protein n=1 Tax=Streptomyces californicus TaxID=67351 RepID=UPI00296E9817|nr:hypothetical protein [Streptomyces californicus]MDW4912603.1 hypothetical protein [Streptomyces californicus]